MSLPNRFASKVVGLSFVPHHPNNILRLNLLAAERYLTVADDGTFWSDGAEAQPEPIPVTLVRNPANEFDSNAIEVHAPILGDEAMLGHIPKDVAAKLSPLLDSGQEWLAHIEKVQIHPDHPTNPGLSIKIERVLVGEPF